MTETHPLEGRSAPDLVLQSTEGNLVRLADRRGRRVLVAFLRNAQCAVCNLWVATMARHAPGLHGLEILAVFESTIDKLRQQLGERVVPFPILADPDGSVHDRFGSRTDPERVQAVIAQGSADRYLADAARQGFAPRREPDSNFFRLPAEILVREDGVVAKVHVALDVGDHLELATIERFARPRETTTG